jgi:hypothetical protein
MKSFLPFFILECFQNSELFYEYAFPTKNNGKGPRQGSARALD